jgi:hypothetical protein
VVFGGRVVRDYAEMSRRHIVMAASMAGIPAALKERIPLRVHSYAHGPTECIVQSLGLHARPSISGQETSASGVGGSSATSGVTPWSAGFPSFSHTQWVEEGESAFVQGGRLCGDTDASPEGWLGSTGSVSSPQAEKRESAAQRRAARAGVMRMASSFLARPPVRGQLQIS